VAALEQRARAQGALFRPRGGLPDGLPGGLLSGAAAPAWRAAALGDSASGLSGIAVPADSRSAALADFRRMHGDLESFPWFKHPVVAD
jgi:hypothetical protein